MDDNKDELTADKNSAELEDAMPCWRNRVLLFLSSQTLSLFGSSLVQYAITWHITIQTQSGIMMTIAIICGFLPTFFLSPFAGVWADRFNRKLLIIISDSFIAISTLILAILFMMGYRAIWLLFAAMSLRAIGSGVQSPAVSAILPQMVPRDKLTKVNAVNSGIHSLVALASPLLSGALLSFASIEIIFFIDVVTAAIAVFILSLFLHVPLHKKALIKENVGYFSDMLSGVKYILKHSFLRVLFIFCAIFFFLAAPACFLSPLHVTRAFGNDVWRLTAIEIAFSVGMIIGSLIIAAWGGFKNRIYTLASACLVFAFLTTVLGLTHVFQIYLVVMGIIGISMPFFNTPATVMLQLRVESDFLGRIFGVLNMLTSSVMPLAMLVFGPLADIIKIEWMFISTGILMFIMGLFAFGNKVLIEAGRSAEKLES